MLNQYVTWSPKSLMINYSSFYGTRKATNHLFTRKLKTIFFPAFLYCFKNTHVTVAQRNMEHPCNYLENTQNQTKNEFKIFLIFCGKSVKNEENSCL